MWMTREEIANKLGIVPNSVRGKVQKGQIERNIENGKNLYRVVGSEAEPASIQTPAPPAQPPTKIIEQAVEREPEPNRVEKKPSGAFSPKEVLMQQLASLNLDRNIDAIEKGDEIDLATGEISRDLAAKISMRRHRQVKEIEDALDRIRNGEYGVCEDCGEPIPEQRLKLFPAAPLCVRCQEDLDHYEKLKDSQGLRGGAWRDDPTEGSFSRSFDD